MSRYLMGVQDGRIPCGNSGLMQIDGRGCFKIVRNAAESFAQSNNLTEVYLVSEYSQEMCEMEPSVLLEYVRKVGERLV